MTGDLASGSTVMAIDKDVLETPEKQKFRKETFTDSRGHELLYRLLVPTIDPANANAHGPQQMPLVLVLHGSGERGNDNSAPLDNGVAELLGSNTATSTFPCFAVVPQCPAEYRWVEVNWDTERVVLPPSPSLPLSATVELLASLLHRHPIDPHRLYLIGLSMGGFGVWDLLSRWPERFAAAIPICGGADDNAIAIAHAVPVWAFHGEGDPIVSVQHSRRAVAALQAAGGTPHYTEYPHVGHDAWTHAFAEPNLLPWLFGQHRTTT